MIHILVQLRAPQLAQPHRPTAWLRSTWPTMRTTNSCHQTTSKQTNVSLYMQTVLLPSRYRNLICWIGVSHLLSQCLLGGDCWWVVYHSSRGIPRIGLLTHSHRVTTNLPPPAPPAPPPPQPQPPPPPPATTTTTTTTTTISPHPSNFTHQTLQKTWVSWTWSATDTPTTCTGNIDHPLSEVMLGKHVW